MINLKIALPSAKLSYDKKQTKQVMRAAASEVAGAARRMIRNGGGGGRQYGAHTASAPGQPPVSLSGRLAASIRSNVKQRGNTIVASIRDVEFYSKFLETGTKRGLAPRPFLSTALEQRKDSIASRIREAIDHDMKFEKRK